MSIVVHHVQWILSTLKVQLTGNEQDSAFVNFHFPLHFFDEADFLIEDDVLFRNHFARDDTDTRTVLKPTNYIIRHLELICQIREVTAVSNEEDVEIKGQTSEVVVKSVFYADYMVESNEGWLSFRNEFSLWPLKLALGFSTAVSWFLTNELPQFAHMATRVTTVTLSRPWKVQH